MSFYLHASMMGSQHINYIPIEIVKRDPSGPRHGNEISGIRFYVTATDMKGPCTVAIIKVPKPISNSDIQRIRERQEILSSFELDPQTGYLGTRALILKEYIMIPNNLMTSGTMIQDEIRWDLRAYQKTIIPYKRTPLTEQLYLVAVSHNRNDHLGRIELKGNGW